LHLKVGRDLKVNLLGLVRIAIPLGCGLPWFGVIAESRHGDPHNWSLPQWQSWRDRQIDRILTPTYSQGGALVLLRTDVIRRASDAYRFLSPLTADPDFLADSGRSKALTNFVRFTKAVQWMASTNSEGASNQGLGMDISDKAYSLYVAPYVGFPGLLASQPFLRDLGAPATYKEAVEMIEANNDSLPSDQKWLVFPFRSQFVTSVDKTTYGRLLVLVPNTRLDDGKTLDRWFSFALATPEIKPIPIIRSVSVIAIVKDTSTPGRSKAFFSDFMREADPSTGLIEPRSTFLMSPSPSKNCYDCHKSALLPIRPKVAYRFDSRGALDANSSDAEPILDKIDRYIQGCGVSDLGHMDRDAYGPSLGPLNVTRSDAFISESSKDDTLPLTSFDKIRANMNCSSCHDGFAKINYLLAVRSDADYKAFESKQGLVQTFIEKGYMPPHNSLTPRERHALWECVSKDYLDLDKGQGQLVNWLRGQSPSSRNSTMP
jgi:hypothetical protein